MQTLISVFDDRARARKAYDRLVQSGFARDDLRLHEAGEHHAVADEEGVRELQDHTMNSAEREIAVDRGILDSLGHFFVSLFGEDRGEKTTGMYSDSVQRGHSVVTVNARNDQEAESAAVTLHECGAVEVEDRNSAGGTPSLPGVRMYERETRKPDLADRAAQVSRELREDREERAYASAMNHVDRDRPK